MNYGKIIYYDTANARGLSTVLFVSGCTNKCEGCHNSETWDFNYGKVFNEEVKNKVIDSLKNPHIKNLVLTGGDPCHIKNIKEIISLCREIRKENIDINIIVYTGYTKEVLEKREEGKELFTLINYLIDGKYIKKLATKQLDYRGSTNQKCWSFEKNNDIIKSIDYTNNYFKS